MTFWTVCDDKEFLAALRRRSQQDAAEVPSLNRAEEIRRLRLEQLLDQAVGLNRARTQSRIAAKPGS
jgi:hypothetical protein